MFLGPGDANKVTISVNISRLQGIAVSTLLPLTNGCYHSRYCLLSLGLPSCLIGLKCSPANTNHNTIGERQVEPGRRARRRGRRTWDNARCALHCN